MKRLGLFLIFVFALSVPAMVSAKTVGDYINLAHQKEGDYYYSGDKRNLRQAIAIYDAIIKQYPTQLPVVYAYRGEDLSAAGYKRDAIKDFDKALALDSADPKGPSIKRDMIYKDLGEAESDIGEYKRAVNDFTRALASHPTDITLLDNRAEARLNAGDCGGAISDYSSAIEHYSSGKNVGFEYELRGIARICTSDLPSALVDYRAAIKNENVSDSQTHVYLIRHDNLN